VTKQGYEKFVLERASEKHYEKYHVEEDQRFSGKKYLARKCASLALPCFHDVEIFLNVKSMKDIRLTRLVCVAIFACWAVLLGGCTPLYLSDTHTTSTPRSQSFDVAQLAREPVATFGLVAPAALQGFSATLSYALIAALSEASPPIRGISDNETLNKLNGQALAAEYGDLISGFARSGILERERLQRIGSALDSSYVLLPGLAEYNQVIIDRISIYGWNVIQSRVTTLRVWLQLWDTKMGQILWQSSGEITLATRLLRPERTVPLDEIARKLWLRMIQDGLVAGKTSSELFSSD
jgi:hypothetical protein